MSTQIQVGLFTEREDIDKLKEKLDTKTAVYISEKKHALIPLRTRRRKAINKLKAVCMELEGETVYVGLGGGSRSHYRVENLRLSNLRMRTYTCFNDSLPSTIWIEGQRSGGIWIDTDQIYDVRRQDYGTYTHWLVDFFNGYRTHELDQFKPHGFDSISITRFNSKEHFPPPVFVACKCGLVDREGITVCPKCERTSFEVISFEDRGPALFCDQGIC